MRTEMRAAAYPDEDPATLPTPEERAGAFVWLAEHGKREESGERFVAARLPTV
jgi:hypothetical protein